MAPLNIKSVVVGDGAVGKTSLLFVYDYNMFPDLYVPTVYDSTVKEVMCNGRSYKAAIWDTGGGEDYHRLRPLSYPGTDVFLICYAVDDRSSFDNVRDYWIPELNHFCPEVPRVLVACKTDLRIDSSSSCEMVTYDEGRCMAKEINARFYETSSLLRVGVKDCFHGAIELAVWINDIHRKQKPKRFFSRRRPKRPVLLPPLMPKADKAPKIKIETSTFTDDWYAILQDPKFHDVTFLVEGERRLHAHRIVLCVASTFFCSILSASLAGYIKSQHQEHKSLAGCNLEDLNAGKVKGISAVYNREESDRPHVVVELSVDIQEKTFVRVLEFLYIGQPKLPENTEEAELEDLKQVAGIFKLSDLEAICTNVMNKEEFLNKAIAARLNNDMGIELKKRFFNKESAQPDVVFNVEGSKVYAHKVILSTRSQVMAAMFSGNFIEGSSSTSEINIHGATLENFLALFEYLYTDHAPIEKISDVIGLLCLADEKGQHRLVNLCELYITKEVKRVFENGTEEAEIDVIGLLNTARIFNATQLVNWCLHFISTNYDHFSAQTNFSNLSTQDRDYVDKHRWPTVSYLLDFEDYEKKLAEQVHTPKEKCCVM